MLFKTPAIEADDHAVIAEISEYQRRLSLAIRARPRWIVRAPMRDPYRELARKA